MAIKADKDLVTINLSREINELKIHKEEINIKINDMVDNLLETEIELYNSKYGKKFELFPWAYGLYAFTFSKFVDPLLYKMAWRLLDKYKQKHFDCQC